MFIKENMKIKWHCENGLVDNLPDVVEEFRIERNLIVNSSLFLDIIISNLSFFLSVSQLKFAYSVHQHLVKRLLLGN